MVLARLDRDERGLVRVRLCGGELAAGCADGGLRRARGVRVAEVAEVVSLPTPYYQTADGGITIYCGDAREIVPHLAGEIAVVSDPPYGMDYDTDGSRFTRGGRSLPVVRGDDGPFDPSQWAAYRWSVLWGFNHFPAGLDAGGALVWIKRTDAALGCFLSDAELAWVRGTRGVYVYRDTRHARAAQRAHPTEKPVGLMSWSIVMSGAPVGVAILDPYMGSGTTLVAARDLGRRAVGVEIEEEYCRVAVERLRQQVFSLPPPPPPPPPGSGSVCRKPV